MQFYCVLEKRLEINPSNFEPLHLLVNYGHPPPLSFADPPLRSNIYCRFSVLRHRNQQTLCLGPNFLYKSIKGECAVPYFSRHKLRPATGFQSFLFSMFAYTVSSLSFIQLFSQIPAFFFSHVYVGVVVIVAETDN